MKESYHIYAVVAMAAVAMLACDGARERGRDQLDSDSVPLNTQAPFGGEHALDTLATGM